MAKQKGLFRITYETLHRVLGLRDDVIIEDIINMESNRMSDDFFIKCRCREFPLIDEGYILPLRDIESYRKGGD